MMINMRVGRSIQYYKSYVFRFPIFSLIIFLAVLNIIILILYLVKLEKNVLNFNNYWRSHSRLKANYTYEHYGQKDIVKHEFKIDYEKNEFIKDGKIFRYISGSFHYFRVNRLYWRDRIIKMRAAGLNALSTYVEWSSHEPSPGKFDFSGDLDLEYFLTLAHEEGLVVLLRPGPYVCAERDFGGLPWWLLSIDQNLRIRTSDQRYQNAVKRWFDKLLPMMEKHLYGNGGPIIMVQIENEYGSYPACDSDHMIWLRDLTKSYVKNNSVLYTTDGAGDSYLRCGAIPGVYATVDFGTATNVDSDFAAMRRYSPKGPLVNSEFYPGWLSHWNENLSTVRTDSILKTMDKLTYYNASYNFYMFFGGTNFGFTAGANYQGFYQPQLTSYDYDAPLDEAGDPTDKYFAIRNYLKKIVNIVDDAPVRSPKGDYGKVELKAKISLFDKNNIPDKISTYSMKPLSFEQLNQSFGFVLYETIIPNHVTDPVMNITDFRDRAIIYLNQRSVGVLSRALNTHTSQLVAHSGQLLSILVENQGRINFGSKMIDPKGILSNVYIGTHVLTSWNMTGFPLKSVDWLSRISAVSSGIKPPAFYQGQFVLPESVKVALDTYLDPTGWTKGVAFINGFNLGRYWPTIGPQVTLYVPQCHLKLYPEINIVTMFELEYASPTLNIKLVNTPKLNITPPVNKRSSTFSEQIDIEIPNINLNY